MIPAAAGVGGLAALYIVVFIDLLGFSMIIPLLPYYGLKFGASDTMVGLLMASYAAAQFIGAPLIGRLSDRYGRRPMILLSLGGTAASFLMLGLAGSLPALFFSRILCGLFGGSISVAQAYITDATDHRHRARALGYIGAAFGLGFILGPVASAFLAQRDPRDPAFAAAFLTLADLAAVWFWLPEPRVHHADREKTPGVRALVAAMGRPTVRPLLVSRAGFYLPFAMFQTIVPLHAIHKFHVTEPQTAALYAYIGVLIVLVQGVAIGRLTHRFAESRLELAAIGLMGLSLGWWAVAPTLPLLLAGLIPLALAGGVFNTVNNSLLTKSVAHSEAGGMLGVANSIESLTRVVGPTLGGILLDRVGLWAPGAFGAACLLLLFPYAWRASRPAT